jgi:hypothetical protein
MPRHHILEGVVVLHKTTHKLHKEKMYGALFKIVFDKTYNKVKWPFLQEAQHMEGFERKWCELITHFFQDGSVGTKVKKILVITLRTKNI